MRAIEAWRDELVTGSPRTPVDLQAAEQALRVAGRRAAASHLGSDRASPRRRRPRVRGAGLGASTWCPIAALPAASGGYLLERGPVIHYLSAERDLVAPEPPRAATCRPARGRRTRRSRAASCSPRSPSAPAKPALSLRNAAGGPRPPCRSPRSLATGGGVGTACASFQNMQFDPLPAARAEAEEVAALWTRSRPDRDAADDAGAHSRRQRSHRRRRSSSSPRGGACCISPPTGSSSATSATPPPARATRAVGGVVSSAVRRRGHGRTARPADEQRRLENPLLLSGLALAAPTAGRRPARRGRRHPDGRGGGRARPYGRGLGGAVGLRDRARAWCAWAKACSGCAARSRWPVRGR